MNGEEAATHSLTLVHSVAILYRLSLRNAPVHHNIKYYSGQMIHPNGNTGVYVAAVPGVKVL